MLYTDTVTLKEECILCKYFKVIISDTQLGNTNISNSKMFYYLVWHSFLCYQYCALSWATIKLVHTGHPKLSPACSSSGDFFACWCLG